jgi:hypothetical protein
MNTTQLALEDALDILDRATAIMVDGESLTFPKLFEDDSDEHQGEGICMEFETQYGTERFHINQNINVKCENGTLVMINTIGHITKIVPLVPMDLG